jgi:pyruvate kinase
MIATARRLTPVWGIHSVVVEREITDEASMTERACNAAVAEEFGESGDNIVIVAGVPFGASGTTNLLRVTKLPNLYARGRKMAEPHSLASPAMFASGDD